MTRKICFSEGWSWFKFKNLGLTLGMGLKFYTSVAKGCKLKESFGGLIPTFVVVTGENWWQSLFFPHLNRVNYMWNIFLCYLKLTCFPWFVLKFTILIQICFVWFMVCFFHSFFKCFRCCFTFIFQKNNPCIFKKKL